MIIIARGEPDDGRATWNSWPTRSLMVVVLRPWQAIMNTMYLAVQSSLSLNRSSAERSTDIHMIPSNLHCQRLLHRISHERKNRGRPSTYVEAPRLRSGRTLDNRHPTPSHSKKAPGSRCGAMQYANTDSVKSSALTVRRDSPSTTHPYTDYGKKPTAAVNLNWFGRVLKKHRFPYLGTI